MHTDLYKTGGFTRAERVKRSEERDFASVMSMARSTSNVNEMNIWPLLKRLL